MSRAPGGRRRRRETSRVVGAVLAGSLTVVAVSACGDSDDTTAAQKSASASASASAQASASRSVAAKDTKRVDVTKAMRDVRCEREDDGWRFSARVRNAADEAADVTVVVRVVPASDANASVGLTSITKTVPGKGSTLFQAVGFSKATANGNTCRATASTALVS